MLGNGFQYDVRHFGECPNVDQLLDLGSIMYCRDTIKIQETKIVFLTSYVFADMMLSNVEFLLSEHMCTETCETLEFACSDFGNFELGTFNFAILKFRKRVFETLTSINGSVEVLISLIGMSSRNGNRTNCLDK